MSLLSGSHATAVSLNDFVDHALKLSSEQLIDAEQILQNTRLSVQNAQNSLYPELSLSFDYEVPYAQASTADVNLTATYTLWDGGNRSSRLAAERFDQRRAELELVSARNAFSYDVANLYLNVFYFERALSSLKNAVREVQAAAPHLTKNSLVHELSIDELEARENYLNLRNRVRGLAHEVGVVRGDLYRLAGLYDDGTSLLPVTFRKDYLEKRRRQQLSKLVEEHPQLLSTRAETRATLASQRADAASHYPEFFVTSDSNIDLDSRPTFSVGIGAKFVVDDLQLVQFSGESSLDTDKFGGNIAANFPSFQGLDATLRQSAAVQATKNVEAVAFNLRRDIESSYQNYLRADEALEVVNTQLRRYTLILQDAQDNGAPLIPQLNLRMIVANLEAEQTLGRFNLQQAQLTFYSFLGVSVQEVL